MRALAFLEWLGDRPETNIAVVTHQVFLSHVFTRVAEGLPEDYTRCFSNAEVRPTLLCRVVEEDAEEGN